MTGRWNTMTNAADIDEQLGVRNPIPNLEIAKTYTQQGEFFIAARNAEKALSFDPTNAEHLWAAGQHLCKIAQLRGRPERPALRRARLHRRRKRCRQDPGG